MRAPLGAAATVGRIVTALTSKVSAAVGVTTTRDVLVRQYLSDPLSGAQNISGTVKGIVRALESLATANAQAQLTIRVVSRDGATARGTLIALSTAGATSEFATALTNRKFPLAWTTPGATLNNVSALAGDRISVEIGARFIATTVATTTATLNFGDTGSDLVEDEVTTTANAPWLELSQTLTFEAVPELRSMGTYLTGVAGTSAALAVPPGVQVDDIVYAGLYKENANAVTVPSGFTEFATLSATDHTLHLFWKRATAADTGTYTFTWTGSNWREGYALAYRNCLQTGVPHETPATAVNNTTSTTTPAVNVTPATENARLLWAATDFSGGNPWTAPANFDRRTSGAGLNDVTFADRVYSGTAATGSVTGTSSQSGRMTAALWALKPAAAGAPGFDLKVASMFLVGD